MNFEPGKRGSAGLALQPCGFSSGVGSLPAEIKQRRIVAMEREILVHVLRETGGNKAKAARMLHIDYKTIHSKIRQYGISID